MRAPHSPASQASERLTMEDKTCFHSGSNEEDLRRSASLLHEDTDNELGFFLVCNLLKLYAIKLSGFISDPFG